MGLERHWSASGDLSHRDRALPCCQASDCPPHVLPDSCGNNPSATAKDCWSSWLLNALMHCRGVLFFLPTCYACVFHAMVVVQTRATKVIGEATDTAHHYGWFLHSAVAICTSVQQQGLLCDAWHLQCMSCCSELRQHLLVPFNALIYQHSIHNTLNP